MRIASLRRALSSAAMLAAAITAGMWAAAAPPASACPVLRDQMAVSTRGERSVDGDALALDAASRAADDFFLPYGNGNLYDLRAVRALIVDADGAVPEAYRLEVFVDQDIGWRFAPGSRVMEIEGAAAVHDRGEFEPSAPLHLYEIVFDIPEGMPGLYRGEWYWVSVSGRSGFDRQTLFAASTTEVIGYPVAVNPDYPVGAWADAPQIGPVDLAIFVRANQRQTFAADFNCGGGISVQDIFDFLAAWFAGDPTADVGGDGVTVQDIFDFLVAWFNQI